MSLLYVIDGYNLTNHPRFGRKFKKGDDPARQVLRFIRQGRLTGSAGNKLVMVFDGYPPGGARAGAEAEAAAVYSRSSSADEKIEKIVEASSGRRNIVVVSDDRQVQQSSRLLGASVMGIEEFTAPRHRQRQRAGDEPSKPEISFSEAQKINRELSRLWLK